MVNSEITFNDLPKVIAELRDEVIGMKVALLDLQKGQTQHKMEKLRRTMNVVGQVAGGEPQECCASYR